MNTENTAQSGNKKWGREMIQQISQFEDWKIAITIPVNMEIEAEHKILNLDEAICYLDGAKDIYKLDCICRTMMGNCDSPKETCIAWDSAKALLDTDIYKNQNAKLISKKEAIETLKMSHDSGLVHMAYAMWDDKVNRICSCCSCCCAVFSSVLDYSMFPELITSEMISVTDMNVCGRCGTCVDRCQFEAREIIDGTLTMNVDLCYGCGVCVTTCPNEAISLVYKS
jgi:NAD-dependent dihydropyrimidine dehydrogenase PreA subunit